MNGKLFVGTFIWPFGQFGPKNIEAEILLTWPFRENLCAFYDEPCVKFEA